jgi:hypothetical protein
LRAPRWAASVEFAATSDDAPDHHLAVSEWLNAPEPLSVKSPAEEAVLGPETDLRLDAEIMSLVLEA